MPIPSPETEALAAHFRLGILFDPRRGPAGERLGRGTGSSLEFQDRRTYAPGDDVRHLDWRAMARTDTLYVRQYREEILPRLEVLVDVSRSMAVEERKARLATDVAALLAVSAEGEGFGVAVVPVGGPPQRLETGRLRGEGLEYEATDGLDPALRRAHGILRAGSVRVLVSDFLSPHVASSLVRVLARGAAGLGLVQVLGEGDAEPPLDVAWRLTDSESDEALDLVIDAGLRARYLERLERLTEALVEETRRQGAAFARVTADQDLDAACRGPLLAGGLLVPA